MSIKNHVIKRMFSRDLLEELDLPYNCTDTEMIHNGRWSLYWKGVFEYEGKHYEIQWEEGATEYQDPDKWGDETEVEAIEVVKVPIVKYEWVAKVAE